MGAVLDRNGLRPSRYYITDDGQVIRENHLLLRIVELYLQNGLMLPERIDINLKIQVIFRQAVTVFANLPQGGICIHQ